MPKKPNKTTARPAKASNNGPAAAAPRQRVARGTGEQRIVDAAIDFFAEQGFRASTRDLAKRLGVTQALLLPGDRRPFLNPAHPLVHPRRA